MRHLLPFIVVLAPALAFAEPRVELVDRGAVVEVIARDVTALRATIAPIRSRLEIPLNGEPALPRVASTDKSIVQVELEGSNPRRLSIKLPHSRETVAALAPHARAIQLGNDLHILIPRKVSATPIELPAPTQSATPPAPAKPAAVVVPPAVVVGPEPAPVKAAPLVEDKAAPVEAEPAPVEAKPAKPAAATPTSPPTVVGSPESSLWQRFSVYAALGLAALGLIGWTVRKRRTEIPGTSIEVVAQRSLGGKARVMWLAAGPRELIVAVTPQQVRVLGQWKAGEAPPSALPRAHVNAVDAIVPESSGPQRTSSAVSGLLKLRQSTAPAVNHEVATGDLDADSLWAREILQASAGFRK